MENGLPDLQPGDCLLYRPSPGFDLIGWIICLKTWSPVCHVEIYSGHGMSVASRNGIGVNQYPLRTNDLAFVLRPKTKASMAPAMEWFHRTAQGQRYDFLGLMCFFLAVRRGSRDRMFCSEFETRFYRYANVPFLARHWDADKVAPGNSLMSPAMNIEWVCDSLAPLYSKWVSKRPISNPGRSE